jgi:oligoribonuclease
VAKNDRVLVWVDLEMTGLDPETCAIVQMAMILTNPELEEIARPLDVTIWQPDSVLETMSPFVRTMHTKNGLIDKIRASTTALEEAEEQALELLSEHAAYRTGRLCGNSVWQDRRFLTRYMPRFEGYLHYRQIDVSTLKELGKWWYGASFDKPDQAQHTALFDIRQSIAELEFYRKQVFK